MKKVKNFIKPKPDPKQKLRDWQRKLQQECRNLDRQIRDIEREEKKVQKSMKEEANRNDMDSAKSLAKEIVMSRRTVNQLYKNKAHLNSLSLRLGESIDISFRVAATARVVGDISKSTEVMKLVNNLMKAPEMAKTMQQFKEEMIKAGIINEYVIDAVDDALGAEGMEEEINVEVDKVLAVIVGETVAELPDVVWKEKINVPVQKKDTLSEEETVVKGVDEEDDEEEVEDIRDQVAKSLDLN